MAIDRERARQCLKAFDFRKLFIEELGWDKFSTKLVKQIDGSGLSVSGRCREARRRRPCVRLHSRVRHSGQAGQAHRQRPLRTPDRLRRSGAWSASVAMGAQGAGQANRRPNLSLFGSGQAGELLFQKLDNLVFTLDEEEDGIHTWHCHRAAEGPSMSRRSRRSSTSGSRRSTPAFLSFIKGIPDKQMESWYASVMINRLMFLYFIQEKGFLNGDKDYLRNKLAESRDRKKRMLTIASFSARSSFRDLPARRRSARPRSNKLLGEIPYLNGGLFQKHQIEELHGKTIAHCRQGL